ncbi:MAG: serine hydrolase [Bacteroidetes bacterium]|nr:serine hydrolase [Bacteroidota bacterium]
MSRLFAWIWGGMVLACLLAPVRVRAQQYRRTDQFANQKVKARTAMKSQVNEITTQNSPLLEWVFTTQRKELGNVISKADPLRLQIIFTQVNRDAQNRPYVKHHTWRFRPDEYFFPASMVKMATAALALEKMNRLKVPGLDVDAEMRVLGEFPCQTTTGPDEFSRQQGFNTLHHNIKDVFLVSGNKSYDRLYEFVGQEYLNTQLWKKGYTSFQIVSRYGHFCTDEQNRVTNPVAFFRDGRQIYDQPLTENLKHYKNRMQRTEVGRGRIVNGQYAPGPRDFSTANTASLQDLHEVLMAIMMPQVMPREKRFYLRREDYRLLHKYMSMYPTESSDPVYEPYYTPTRMKYILYGNYGNHLPGVRVFNKVGQAFGFLTDCAYIVDFEHNVEFFLSATLYCNSDEVLNDDQYDYYTVGFPFLKKLGEVLLELERRRKKSHPARFDFLQHDYSTY